MIDAPPRTLEQRMEALAHANKIRTWRARFKRDLKTHPDLAVFQINAPTPWIEAMRVSELVCALPGYGPLKASGLLRRCGVPWEKRIGSLTQRQRDALTREMRPVPAASQRGKVCVRGHDLTDPSVVRIRPCGRKRCLRCAAARNRSRRRQLA